MLDGWNTSQIDIYLRAYFLPSRVLVGTLTQQLGSDLRQTQPVRGVHSCLPNRGKCAGQGATQCEWQSHHIRYEELNHPLPGPRIPHYCPPPHRTLVGSIHPASSPCPQLPRRPSETLPRHSPVTRTAGPQTARVDPRGPQHATPIARNTRATPSTQLNSARRQGPG